MTPCRARLLFTHRTNFHSEQKSQRMKNLTESDDESIFEPQSWFCVSFRTWSVFVKVFKPRNSHLCVHICTCIVIYSLIGSEDKEAWYLHIGHIRAGRSVVVMSSNSRLCNHQQPFTTDPNNSHRHQIPSFSCHLDLQFGQIRFTIRTNTFCNLVKYIF